MTVPDRECPIDYFSPLSAVGGCRHGFTLRVPGVDVKCDRDEAIARLASSHRMAATAVAGEGARLVLAEQVHGHEVAVLTPESELPTGPMPGVDGLVTNRADVCLGIMVADCGAVYLVDPEACCIGLVHSGRKGTDEEIVPSAIEAMGEAFAADPKRMVAVLGPCIRPPHYEVDFAARIVAQCHAVGIGSVHDGGVCTGSDTERYYSYRMEKGKTGRMLALLALA